MRSQAKCYVCQLGELVEGMRRANVDNAAMLAAADEYMEYLKRYDMSESPLEMARQCWRRRVQSTGVADPYREQKDAHNQAMLDNYDYFHQKVMQQPDPVKAAFTLCIAGNVMDLAAPYGLDMQDVVNKALHTQLTVDHVAQLAQRMRAAKHVLYLCDNCGEIVLDKLLLRVLLECGVLEYERVTAAVRGAYTVNDATMEDALRVGLTDVVRVIDNGDDSPGCNPQFCTPKFQRILRDSDLLVCKGQGNWEGLSTYADKTICYMMMVKCPIIGEDIDYPVGSLLCLLRRQ